jgi:hypothetical protein
MPAETMASRRRKGSDKAEGTILSARQQARSLDSHGGDLRVQQLQIETEALALVFLAAHRAYLAGAAIDIR